MEANPGILLNNRTSIYLIDLMRQMAEQDRELGKLATATKNPAKWAEIQDAYLAEHPLMSPFTKRPIDAPGGGIPGAPERPQAIGGQAAANAPGPAAAQTAAAAEPPPVPVSSVEEAMKLPGDTRIRLPDGRLGRTPGKAQ
jgi:hypothetical protein